MVRIHFAAAYLWKTRFHVSFSHAAFWTFSLHIRVSWEHFLKVDPDESESESHDRDPES